MRSTLNPRPADGPHDFVVVPPDMVRVVPSDDELSHVLRDAARHLSEPQARAEPNSAAEAPVPALDTTFRAAAVGDLLPGQRSPFGNWARRGLTAFAFAAITGAVGIAWQFYGAPAKQLIANWTPLALTSSQASEEAAPSAQPDAPATEAAAPEAAPAQEAPAAPATPTAAEAAATATAALSPDQSQSQLQSMARDLASAGQEIQQLKASIAELKAGQQQISRELAKAAERPRAPALAPHAAAPAHKPPPRQTAARTYAPAAAPYMPPPPQAAAPPPGDPSAPRPPMPVR
jgi:hypothetical protein